MVLLLVIVDGLFVLYGLEYNCDFFEVKVCLIKFLKFLIKLKVLEFGRFLSVKFLIIISFGVIRED